MKYLLLRKITCLDLPQRNRAQYNPRWLLVFFCTRWDAYCFPHTYFFSNTRSNLLDISQVCWGGRATFIVEKKLKELQIMYMSHYLMINFVQGCVNDNVLLSSSLNGQNHLLLLQSLCRFVLLGCPRCLEIMYVALSWGSILIFRLRSPWNEYFPQQYSDAKPIFFLNLWFTDFPLRPVHQVPAQHGHCEAGEESHVCRMYLSVLFLLLVSSFWKPFSFALQVHCTSIDYNHCRCTTMLPSPAWVEGMMRTARCDSK